MTFTSCIVSTANKQNRGNGITKPNTRRKRLTNTHKTNKHHRFARSLKQAISLQGIMQPDEPKRRANYPTEILSQLIHEYLGKYEILIYIIIAEAKITMIYAAFLLSFSTLTRQSITAIYLILPKFLYWNSQSWPDQEITKTLWKELLLIWTMSIPRIYQCADEWAETGKIANFNPIKSSIFTVITICFPALIYLHIPFIMLIPTLTLSEKSSDYVRTLITLIYPFYANFPGLKPHDYLINFIYNAHQQVRSDLIKKNPHLILLSFSL